MRLWLDVMMVCRSQCSFDLGSFFLLGGGSLGLSGDLSGFDCLGNRGEQGLSAVGLDGPDAAVLDGLPEEDAGDGADDLELFDEGRGGDVLAELGDGGEDAVVGGPVEEDGVVGFLFDLTLGPFLGTALLLGGSLGDRVLALLLYGFGHVWIKNNIYFIFNQLIHLRPHALTHAYKELTPHEK